MYANKMGDPNTGGWQTILLESIYGTSNTSPGGVAKDKVIRAIIEQRAGASAGRVGRRRRQCPQRPDIARKGAAVIIVVRPRLILIGGA